MAWNHLATGNGGIDWADLPYIAELLGIDDPAALLEQLYSIKHHPRPADNHGPGLNSP